MIFILTGRPHSGKDTFIEEVKKLNKGCVINYSTVDPIKDFLKKLGWDGITKTDAIRHTISSIKKAANSEYLLLNYNYHKIKEMIEHFHTNDIWESQYMIFIQCREPAEIRQLQSLFKGKIILIKSSKAQYPTNISDQICEAVHADYIIENNGTIEEYKKKINNFYKKIKSL